MNDNLPARLATHPALLDEAWSVEPVDPQEAQPMMKRLYFAMKCQHLYARRDEGGSQIGQGFGALVAHRGYTRAEFLYGVACLPFDKWAAEQITGKTENPFVLLAALDRIVEETRLVRSMLHRDLNEFEYSRLLQMCSLLRPEMFGTTGFDGDDRPLRRFVGCAGPRRPDYAALHKAEMEDTRRRAATFHGWTT